MRALGIIFTLLGILGLVLAGYMFVNNTNTFVLGEQTVTMSPDGNLTPILIGSGLMLLVGIIMLAVPRRRVIVDRTYVERDTVERDRVNDRVRNRDRISDRSHKRHGRFYDPNTGWSGA